MNDYPKNFRKTFDHPGGEGSESFLNTLCKKLRTSSLKGAWVFIFTLSLLGVVGSTQLASAGSDAAISHPMPYLGTPSNDVAITRISRYLTMRDGVKIAIDLYLPKQLKEGETLPTMLHQTRYWRSIEYRWPWYLIMDPAPRGLMAKFAKRFLANGYAWVDVDVRGSGASFGTRRFPYSPEEIKDGAEIVEWIVNQPWSDGNVGAIGISYDGAAAELLLANKHPAVKAAAPLFSAFDLYAEIAYPGGIHLTWFTNTWQQVIDKLDRNILPFGGWLTALFAKGVLPADEDSDRTLLGHAIQDHSANWNPHQEAMGIVFRDDPSSFSPASTIDTISSHSYATDVGASGAAVYSYSGWFDGAYPHAAIRRHVTLSNPANKLIIGPWDHGGKNNISPFGTGPSEFDHAGELLKFFDEHLKGIDTGIREEKPVHYYTMGEEQWKATDTWPPKATMVSYYLAPDNRLTTQKPSLAQASDTYQVDPTTGTGEESRWHTLIHRPITNPYPDRSEQDQKLLSYTTIPLDQDIEVTGHPLVTLYVASTATDGTFFVYLEDVDEEGHVTYITEGMLRALHRHFGKSAPPYKNVVPYRTFSRRDARSLMPGEITSLTFDLLPTSYVFKKGHRIRLAVAGADHTHFRILPGPPPTITLYRTSIFPSHLHLPIVSSKIH